MSFYLNCSYTLHFFVAILNHTTVVQTLPIAPLTQFQNSRPAMSQSVSRNEG